MFNKYNFRAYLEFTSFNYGLIKAFHNEIHIKHNLKKQLHQSVISLN